MVSFAIIGFLFGGRGTCVVLVGVGYHTGEVCATFLVFGVAGANVLWC